MRRGGAVLAGAGLLAAVLSGCGAAGAPAGPAAPPTPRSGDSTPAGPAVTTMTFPAGTPTRTLAPLSTVDGQQQLPARLSDLRADPPAAVVTVDLSGCATLTGYREQDSGAAITLTVYGSRPPARQVCTLQRVATAVLVPLDTAPGARSVVVTG